MKITSNEQLQSVEKVISHCNSDVWIESACGERFNMKNDFDRVRGFARLMEDDKNEMEFFAHDFSDQLLLGEMLWSMSA